MRTEPKARAWAEISLDAVRGNVRTLRDFLGPETELMAVVKADAYGHGLVPVARAAVEAGAEWLGVAAVSEGAALREAGIETPISLLCAPAPQEAEALLAYRLTATVGDRATLEAIAHAARSGASPERAPAIHLEIDTGMGRSGARPDEAVALWREAIAAGLRVTGLTTHHADADGADETFAVTQEAAFARVRASLQEAGARFDLIHLRNSAATCRFPAPGGNLARPGLLLYGILPPVALTPVPSPTLRERGDYSAGLSLPFRSGTSRKQRNSRGFSPPPSPNSVGEGGRGEGGLLPVLTLKARVATVRSLPTGHPISYGVTHRLTRPSRVATVLIGYGDGYPRRLSNNGQMLLRGQRAPILGRVCMDQTVVDVTDIPGVAPGEEAVCIGAQGRERIRVEEIARRVETTEHEVTTCLTARLPRCYI